MQSQCRFTCIAPTVALSGNTTINQGQSANITLTFTGALPHTYTLSDGQTGTTSTNPLTISVFPLSTTTYTATAVSNGCGAGTTSGSATVTVTRMAGLITCFPLDASVNDQISINNGSVFSNGGSFAYTTNRNGTISSALSISNGAYVEFPTNNLLNNNFTHSLWVSPASLPSNGNNNYILSIGGIGQSQELYIENVSGVLGWVFRSATTAGNIDVKYQGTITTGAWYHVGIVRTANALQMYINGVLVRSSSAEGLSSTYSSPSIGRLGTQSSGLVNFFNGKIDDVRLFKGGLNGLEISSLYNATLNCPTIVDIPLISLTNLTDSTLCRNQLESITFQQSSIIVGSTYTVQLSNANGSFANPTTIGTGTLAPIQISIPTSITPSGTGYLIRVINGTTVSFNTLPVTVLPIATGSISGTYTINAGQSANLSINFTGTAPWVYTVSDGINSLNYITSLSYVIQNISPIITTTYTLGNIRDNVCGTGTTSGSAVITVNSNTQLLACYPFNGNAQDSKGTYHGTVNGAILTTDRFGTANSAYNFNGSSNYISIPGANLAPSEFTYSTWVNASDLPAYGEARTILSIGNDGGDQHLMLLNSNATSGSGWNYGSYTGFNVGANPPLLSYTSVIANKWNHIVVVRTFTERKIYINGQLSVSNTATAAYYSTPTLAKIGSRYNATQFFKGKIDDVKIYSGALTDEEVLLLYNEEQGECSSPCSGMIYSLNSGNWNMPATWSCGRVPDFTDKVLVKSGHTITISTDNAKAKKLIDNGQVKFANLTSKLTFVTSPIVLPTTITLILQPGPTDGKDSEVGSYSPNASNPDVIYTNIYAWTIGGSENIKRCFFGYDLSSIPTNAVVDSAFLSLYFSQAFINGPQGAYYSGHTVYGGDNAFFINRITGNWTESGVTWNTQPTFSTVNQVSIAPFTDYRQDYSKMNVKNLVADMVANPINSYGFMLRHQIEAIYKITIFATSDDPNPSVRPKFQAYYHLP